MTVRSCSVVLKGFSRSCILLALFIRSACKMIRPLLEESSASRPRKNSGHKLLGQRCVLLTSDPFRFPDDFTRLTGRVISYKRLLVQVATGARYMSAIINYDNLLLHKLSFRNRMTTKRLHVATSGYEWLLRTGRNRHYAISDKFRQWLDDEQYTMQGGHHRR
eukprot:5142243-Pleurochrysis_carterae.AAC.3